MGGQGVYKTLLTPRIALIKGCSQVTPGPRNSPREPQRAGYIKITATATAQSTEGRRGRRLHAMEGGVKGECWEAVLAYSLKSL